MPTLRWLPLLCLPLLAACVDDRVAYEGEGNQVITVIREQKWFWDKSVELSLVVARMPECMRRHTLGAVSAADKIELWQYQSDTFTLKVGSRLFATETRTCEGLERLKEEPPGGMGEPVGAFVDRDGKLFFVAAGASK